MTSFPYIPSFSDFRTQADTEVTLGDDFVWAYRRAFHNYIKTDAVYDAIRGNIYGRANLITAIRKECKRLQEKCHVFLTYESNQGAWAFVKGDAENQARPTIYISVMLLELLRIAPSTQEQHHVLHYAFVAIMYAVEQLLLRFVSFFPQTSP